MRDFGWPAGVAVSFGVKEGNILADFGDCHWLAEDFATGLGDTFHGGVDVHDRNDDGRMLRRPVGVDGE